MGHKMQTSTESRKGSASVAVRYSGEAVMCTSCGAQYQARSFEPVKASLCETCRQSRQDTGAADRVIHKDFITARILAESFGISVIKLTGLGRILWHGLGADDHLTCGQEQRLTKAAEAMACEY